MKKKDNILNLKNEITLIQINKNRIEETIRSISEYKDILYQMHIRANRCNSYFSESYEWQGSVKTKVLEHVEQEICDNYRYIYMKTEMIYENMQKEVERLNNLLISKNEELENSTR